MVNLVTKDNEWLKPYLQAKCERIGYCPEKHGGCGRKPNLKQIINIYDSCKDEIITSEDMELLRKDEGKVDERLVKLFQTKSVFEES